MRTQFGPLSTPTATLSYSSEGGAATQCAMRVLQNCRGFDGVAEGAPFMGGAAGRSGVGGTTFWPTVQQCYVPVHAFGLILSFAG